MSSLALDLTAHQRYGASRQIPLQSASNHFPELETGQKTMVSAVLLVAVLAISSAAVLVRGINDAPSISIALWRTTIVATLLLPAVRPVSRKDALLIAAAGACLAGHFWAWFSGIQQTTVMRATVLVCTTPIWSALLEWVLLRNRPQNRVWFGILVALPGIALMSTGDYTSESWVGDSLALLGGVLGSFYLVIGRSVRSRVPIQSYACLVCLAAALWLCPLAWLTGSELVGFSGRTWLLIGALAAGPQMLGHNGFNYALRYLPAATVSTVMLLEPVGSTLLALLILGEVPSGISIAGASLAVVGVVVATLRTPTKQRQSKITSPMVQEEDPTHLPADPTE